MSTTPFIPTPVEASRFNRPEFSSISTTKVLPTSLQVMTMTNDINPSLVISHIPIHVSTSDIKEWIETRDHLGYVDLIQFKNNNHQSKAVYIHFKRWSTSAFATKMRHNVNQGRFIKLYDSDRKFYWKMIKSDMGRPLPLISNTPYIKWIPRTEDGPDGQEMCKDADIMVGNIPNPEERKMSLVIPLVMKGYTTEHIKYVFEEIGLFETITRIDPVPLKPSHKYYQSHITFYIHGIFANTIYANYFQRYLSEGIANNLAGYTVEMNLEIVHKIDARPRNHSHTNWSWIVKKSDIAMPERTQSKSETETN